MESLIGKDNIVRNQPSRDEGALIGPDHIMEVGFYSISCSFHYDFKRDVAKQNRSISNWSNGSFDFENKANVSFIKGRNITVMVEDV